MKIKSIKKVGIMNVVELSVSNSTYIDEHGIISHNCKHCERLHLMPDGVTPRVYKMSELRATPGDWRNPEPSVSVVHVNCRCVLVYLAPGFGFTPEGKHTYISKDHDEFKKQRG